MRTQKSCEELSRTQREKAIKAEREAFIKRRGRSLDILIAHGILKEGTRLHLIHPPRLGLEVIDEQAKHATFYGRANQGVKWDYDGNAYSLSGLCKVICDKYGGNVGSGAFAGPDHRTIEGESVSLAERAVSLSEVGSNE